MALPHLRHSATLPLVSSGRVLVGNSEGLASKVSGLQLLVPPAIRRLFRCRQMGGGLERPASLTGSKLASLRVHPTKGSRGARQCTDHDRPAVLTHAGAIEGRTGTRVRRGRGRR